MTDHAAIAEGLLARVTLGTDPAGGDNVARAQVRATLALVEEQRTTNLIARQAVLVAIANGPRSTLTEAGQQDWKDIETALQARLERDPNQP